jgi:hypothetical protein
VDRRSPCPAVVLACAPVTPTRGIPPYRWLAALPAVLMLGGVPFVNRVHVLVFGLPPLLVWMVACVLLTSGVLALVERLDARAAAGRRPPEDEEQAT